MRIRYYALRSPLPIVETSTTGHVVCKSHVILQALCHASVIEGEGEKGTFKYRYVVPSSFPPLLCTIRASASERSVTSPPKVI